MLSNHVLRLDTNGTPTAEGPLALADAFFAPEVLTEGGLEPLLRGLAGQQARAIDLAVIDDVRNLLFGPPGAGGLDLASLNIQRGRDHGLPSFGAVRAAYGLRAPRDFTDIATDATTQAALASVYTNIDQVDPWIGVLAERPVPDGLVGETARAILVDQFRRLRDGDRFWYETYLPRDVIAEIEGRTLATIIRDNTDIGPELPSDVFRMANR